MRAQTGDWLVVERGDLGREVRRGRVEEVRGADGTPPYLVRWLDSDRTTLVFPGPDAHVLTSAELDRTEAAANRRFTAIQREISHHR
ncbi:MAG: DUF1918 domain-containing protein [Labedaea sp.]